MKHVIDSKCAQSFDFSEMTYIFFMGSRGRFERVHVGSVKYYVGIYSLYVGFCIRCRDCQRCRVGCFRPGLSTHCMDCHILCAVCFRYQVDCSGAIWDDVTSAWAVVTSMWASTISIWSIVSSVWDIVAHVLTIVGTMGAVAGAR